MKLAGKSAIVTGAGDGIGRGIALAIARAGASVAVCDINRETVEETAKLLERVGVKVFSRCIDIRECDQVEEFVNAVASALEGPDILVNNAAVMPLSRLDVLEASVIDDILAVNLKAPILFTKYVVSHMKQRGGGSIIYMSSVTGHNGFPDLAVYGATKGGLIALARGHAMELAPYNIRVNSVSPGTVDSPMLHRFIEENASDKTAARQAFDQIHPRGKVGSIEEVAAVFVFLASDEAANITAEDIRCDGGYAVQGTHPKS